MGDITFYTFVTKLREEWWCCQWIVIVNRIADTSVDNIPNIYKCFEREETKNKNLLKKKKTEKLYLKRDRGKQRMEFYNKMDSCMGEDIESAYGVIHML